jgi:PleD family two-component response regulator
LYLAAGPNGVAWLARQRQAPTVFLTGLEPDVVAQAYEQGVSLCLPRQVTLDNPHVLAAALNRALQTSELQRSIVREQESLYQCRRQVDRLVNLLWRALPADPDHQWFTHRHILERLQEEVSRSGRHGGVFTVALGAVETKSEARTEPQELAEWTTQTLARIKRRCDVAGHYGLQGFMLLMVQTPEAGGAAGCRRLQQYLHEAARPPLGPHGPIRACFGLSSFSSSNATSQSLLSRAEQHLEAAKADQDGGIVAD